jgi:hypothetical protein
MRKKSLKNNGRDEVKFLDGGVCGYLLKPLRFEGVEELGGRAASDNDRRL